MLYPKNKQELTKELFLSPTSEYRGAPFWAWNCKLEKDSLLRQIDYLKDMGMGGYNIHVRTGMASEYLGEEFMSLVKACNDKGKENSMLTWLYDEDRWPSGAAGGFVTKELKYRMKFLVFTKKAQENIQFVNQEFKSTGKAVRSNNRTKVGTYEINLSDGCLKSYRKLGENETPAEGANIWYAYVEISGDNPWFNNQAYVNTLDKAAIDKFIQYTHEAYLKEFGHEFGKSIPAIFTDEPQFTHKQTFGFAEDEQDIILPFTDDLEETFVKQYGSSLTEHLPELFWELPDGEISVTRYRYHDHLCDRFSQAFSANIGDWCQKHGIALTGHMMAESTLDSQTTASGEVMRSLSHFQIPGIDMLCDRREFSTAKQAQSVAHQCGREGVMSEIYGVTNWDFDFRNHKLGGDWQAALGITVRVHHLAWVTMEGEAKRDYPAPINYQSPWYKEYRLIEDHFGRLNTALTRGKPAVKVGMLHPIESYWLYFGPKEQTAVIRSELDTNFKNIIDWLLFGLIDFDFISEALLPEQCAADKINSSSMKVGEMAYETILVPGLHTMRSTTLERLRKFRNAGGNVIFIGQVPDYIDGVKNNAAHEFSAECRNIPFSKAVILNELKDIKDIDIKYADGSPSNNLLYQMRENGDKKWLFISHAYKTENPDLGDKESITIRIKGAYKPVVFNTMTGGIYPCPAVISGNETVISHEFYEHDSLLLCLENGVPELAPEAAKEQTVKALGYVNSKVPVTLSEPNVLVLDIAEYSFDNGPWQPAEEILRIDNKFRKHLGFPLRMEAFAQPWVDPVVEAPRNTLSLRYKINSDIPVTGTWLAIENPGSADIILNGQPVSKNIDGWFTDECIKRVKLQDLPAGESELVINIAFGPKTNVECCYLLGDFGVKVSGSNCTITHPVRELNFGDWTTQGLPFYAGNVTYHCDISCESGNLSMEAPLFRNPLISVALDNKETKKIAIAPYRADFGAVEAGKHALDITAFGNRVNTFGTLHNCNKATTWFGPNSWRTTDNSWSYEYQLKPTGILKAPNYILK